MFRSLFHTIFSFFSTKAMRTVAKLFSLLLLAGASHVALAQYCSRDVPHVAQINFPATITVPRDAAATVGTLLTPWTNANASEDWVCRIDANYRLTSWIDMTMAAPDRINYSGTSYALIKTSVDGVGIIARVTLSGRTVATANGSSNSFSGTYPVDGRGFYNNLWKNFLDSVFTKGFENDVYAQQTVSLALIRTGTQPLGGKTMAAGTVGQTGLRFAPYFLSGSAPLAFPLQFAHDIQYGAVNFIDGTCQTPDVTFNMGTVPLSTFQGTGTRNGNWKMQNLNINNCPAGLNRLSVVLTTPSTGWLDSVNKVFKLNNSGDVATAQGIGIQLAVGPTQTIASYDTQILLNSYGYNSTTGGSFAVPLSARYVKPASSATVSPGRANGMMVFTMVYQ